MRRVLYFLLILVIVGCGNKQSQATQQNNIVEVGLDSTKLTTKDFKNLSYRDYVLDKSAKYKVSGWAKYNEVNDIITEVKNANLSYFKNDKKVVETTINELMATIPEAIDTEAIRARVLVLQNMYLRLNSIVNLHTSTKEDKKKAIIDFLDAFSNLNFQINKKFERDAQNIIKP